ncbi:MAG: magnesium chelatase ATPase subunit I [Thermoleophilia bacterium]
MSLRYYPFTAIVDQERLKKALLVNAVNPAVGGVLVKGPAGTGKSTAARGLAELLPEIEVVADCPFSCDPAAPCPACSDRRQRGEELPVARRRRRIVDLPLNATEDRVAGTVDIARALREGERALQPGLLAEANRGILYVDEINLLDDHLTDILLDAAALGVNVVEREGISIAHPARFILVGTMNEEEGELRPQIADRIGLQVAVDAVYDPEARAEIVRRREAFTADPDAFLASWAEAQQALARCLAEAEQALGRIRLPRPLYGAIARLVVKAGVASHRADVTIVECAKAIAALAGREQVEDEDVVEAAALALGHRMSADPFGPAPAVDSQLVRRLLEEALDAELAKKAAPERVT